jgi:hypothetical protein
MKMFEENLNPKYFGWRRSFCWKCTIGVDVSIYSESIETKGSIVESGQVCGVEVVVRIANRTKASFLCAFAMLVANNRPGRFCNVPE